MKEIETLQKEFKRIKQMGWVKSINVGKGSVGLTFEKLLGKETENASLPDYLGIELKTHRTYSKFHTTLFNATPDGTGEFEIKRIVKLYGYPDRNFKNCNILNGSINAVEKKNMGLWFSYQLEVNYQEKKVYLCIYHELKLIDKKTYWTFDYLKETLERKLPILAYIDAEEKKIKQETYFRYTELRIYKLRNFSYFLKALEDGYIIVNFSIGVFKDGDKKGQMHDHGTAFRILKKDLNKIFYRVGSFNFIERL